MALRAIKTRLIIKKQEHKQESAGGIFIGSAMTDGATVFAEVVSVGPEVKADIRVGDVVLPDWRAVVPVKYDGVDYLLVEEQGLVAIFDREE